MPGVTMGAFENSAKLLLPLDNSFGESLHLLHIVG